MKIGIKVIRSNMASLSITNLSKKFGDIIVLDQTSLSIDSGQFFSILGPSGCGKSTLLRIIAGLETQDSGTVLVNGHDIAQIPPQKRGIGMVFQQYALWPHMTIAQNVRFGLQTLPLTNKDRDQRMLKALQRVQVTELRNRYPHEVSGGQQQRVALARALAMQPSIILLDEPLSNLDARLRSEIRHELAELHRDLGTTMLYVTHDQEDALMLSSRIAIMHKGRVEQVGPPKDIYQTPANRFTAQFLGDANLLPCSVLDAGNIGMVQLRLDLDPEITISARCEIGGIPTGSTGFLCVRPMAIDITDARSGIIAEISRLTYRGDRYDIDLILISGQTIRASVTSFNTNRELSIGQKVSISWPPQRGVFIKE